MEKTYRAQTEKKRAYSADCRGKSSTDFIRQNKIVEPQLAKLVIHNPAVGIEYPPKQYQQFAVIQVDGFQYKVLQDSTLLLDTKEGHAINEPVFKL